MLRKRFFVLTVVAITTLLLATACIDDATDDPDRETGAPVGTGDGTPAGTFGTPTAEDGEGDDEDTVPGPEGTVVPEATVEPNDDEHSTPVSVAERTVTPDSDDVGPQGEPMFRSLDAQIEDLDNFTLTVTGQTAFQAVDDTEPIDVDLTYQQSSPDTYYMHNASGEFDAEIWSVDGEIWIQDEDGVQEATNGIPEEFDVTVYLTMLPEVDRISDAEHVGQEERDGRTTEHYTIPADEAIAYMPGLQDAAPEDAEGSLDIWVDEEEDLIVHMVTDIRWADADGNELAIDLEYTLSDIGETEEISPPESE